MTVMLALPLRLSLLVTQRPAGSATIIDEIQDFGPAEAQMRRFVGDGSYSPWMWLDERSGAVVARVLHWEEAGDRKTMGPGIIEDILTLVVAHGKAMHDGAPAEFEDHLLQFYQAFGSLFQNGAEDRTVPLVYFRAYLAFFRWLVIVCGSTLALDRRTPPLILGESFLRVWQETMNPDLLEEGSDERLLIDALGLPTMHKALLQTPRLPGQFRSREDGVQWIREKVVQPVVNRVLADRIAPAFSLTKDGKLRGAMYPKDLFTLAVLSLLAVVELRGLHECACGCGELVPATRRYLNKAHARRVQVKQNVLAVFRSRRRRGSLSAAGYSAVKELINELYRAGTRDKDELVRLAEESLGRG